MPTVRLADRNVGKRGRFYTPPPVWDPALGSAPWSTPTFNAGHGRRPTTRVRRPEWGPRSVHPSAWAKAGAGDHRVDRTPSRGRWVTSHVPLVWIHPTFPPEQPPHVFVDAWYFVGPHLRNAMNVLFQ